MRRAATGAPAPLTGAPGPKRATAADERRRKREHDRLLALLNEDALEEETVEIEIDPTIRRQSLSNCWRILPGRSL